MKSNYQSYSKVVERLGQYREQLGVSQAEMGSYFAVTQSHYQKLEKGMKVISQKSLQAFGAAGYDVFWLLTGKKNDGGFLDSYVSKFDSARQRQKFLEGLIWATEEGTRIKGDEYDGSLHKAYELMKVSELDEHFIWKRIRKAEDLTQIQMANLLEINIKRYRKIEKGEIAEDAAILASLYENLHYSPMLILDRKKYCLDELNRIWSKFDASLLKRLLRYLEIITELLSYGEENHVCQSIDSGR